MSDSEIEQIVPWPIKKSYDALLFNYLNKLDVKKIGIEIFLSAKSASHSVYDRVLQNETEKFNNITLSSVAGSTEENNRYYSTGSLSLSNPKQAIL